MSTNSKSRPAARKAAQKNNNTLWIMLGVFENVTGMGGGMNAWRAAGFPVVSGD